MISSAKNNLLKGAGYRWAIVAILGMAYLFVYFHRLSLSVVADDLVKAFQTSAGIMGLLGSIYFYCYAVMQLPAGLLSDSIGPRRTVTFFLLIAAAGSLLFGLAQTIEMAFAGRILVGLGVSMVFIPTMKILSQWFQQDEFAQMAGLMNAVGGAGVLAATWALALLTAAVGWRFSFKMIGVLTLLIAVLAWLLVRDRPPSDRLEEETFAAPPAIGLMEGVRRVFSDRRFWPLAVWFFFDCGVFFGFGGLWGGPYLMHIYGMSRAEAGSVLSMIAWGMIVGSPLLGALSDRVLRSRRKLFILCTSLLTLLMLFLWLFPQGLPRAVLYLFFFLFSISSSAVVAIGFTTAKELFPVAMAGTSVGTVNLFPFLGGAVFMPLLGKLLDGYARSASGAYPLEAYSALLGVLLAAAVVTLFCAFLIRETFQG